MYIDIYISIRTLVPMVVYLYACFVVYLRQLIHRSVGDVNPSVYQLEDCVILHRQRLIGFRDIRFTAVLV